MEAGLTLRRWVGLLAIVAGATGCAAVGPVASVLTGGSSPASNLEVHSQTLTKLDEANFITVRTNVVGTSKGFKLLGFITICPATLNKAMNRLYAKAQAQEGRPQTLANLVVERTGIYVILFSIPQITTRADLVEFVPVQEDEAPLNPLGLHPVGDPSAKSHAPTRRQGDL